MPTKPAVRFPLATVLQRRGLEADFYPEYILPNDEVRARTLRIPPTTYVLTNSSSCRCQTGRERQAWYVMSNARRTDVANAVKPQNIRPPTSFVYPDI